MTFYSSILPSQRPSAMIQSFHKTKGMPQQQNFLTFVGLPVVVVVVVAAVVPRNQEVSSISSRQFDKVTSALFIHSLSSTSLSPKKKKLSLGNIALSPLPRRHRLLPYDQNSSSNTNSFSCSFYL